jgi:ketosteroid isomerase-like protein
MNDVVNEWMSGYRTAWESNDPADIARLFTADALYYNEPFGEPSRGREAIIQSWIERRDAPGSTTFTRTLLAATDELAFVQGETDYGSIKYSNLWVLRFAPSGEAREFTEWWMDQSSPSQPS